MKTNDLIKNILDIVIAIILKPADFWEGQKEKTYKQWQLFGNYFFPLVMVASVAVFLGAWFSSTHFYIQYAFFKTIREFLLFIALYFLCILIINQLINTFEGEKNTEAVKILVTFSLIPYLLTSFITGLFPGLYIINVAGLYSAYLFWIGAKTLLTIPERKRSGFILVSILLCLFVFSFLSILFWKIFVSFY
ncbi:MAG: YIP1 family protein [Prolixibacteraceae bacterium]|nr:YIP1 family protein [Prolixibacteraceae bacterium]